MGRSNYIILFQIKFYFGKIDKSLCLKKNQEITQMGAE